MSDGRRAAGGGGLAQFIDRLVAPEWVARGGDELRRLRIGLSALLLSALLMPLGIVDSSLRGKWLAVVALSTMLVCLLGASAWVRRHGWSARVGHLATLCSTGYPLSAVVDGASVHDPALMVLMATPVAAFFFVGPGGGWAWCGACVAGFLAMGVATVDDAVAIHERVWMLSSLTVSLTTAAYAFERLRRSALVEVEAARREAEASASAKSQFLANMSHEIRTPMNGVLGMLGIVLDTRLDPDQRSYLETAHGSGMALLDLLNDILDFSKMGAKQMTLEASPFDLRTSIEDVLDQAAVQAGKKDLELASRYVPGTPTHVLGDHGRIRQILINLVSNAVKFTDRGHVLVSVEQVSSGEGAARLRCTVEDTGIGIPPAEQTRIFDAFRQVDGSSTRERAGTGLGLAIVRELVELMGGRLGLESEVGKGTKLWFELTLPLATDSPSETMLAVDLAGLRVLVVDDHWVNRWVLQEQLVRWGFRTEECDSAAHALEALRAAAARGEPFDLALLDYQMPKVDGLGLARAMRADPRLRDVTWVMLSSVMQRPRDEELRAAGCAAYLVKPVHQSDLMNVLAAVWARRGDPHAPPLTRPPRGTGETEVGIVVPQGLRVLVVEDNPVNQRVAQRLLSDLGCRVDVAGNGLEALELVASMPYDLVLMDVQMPYMDGLEATRELRRREEKTGAHVHVVAMTAHAMPEDRERCLAAGMDGYLSKPVKRRDLVRELRRRSSAASALAPGASERSDAAPAWALEAAWDVAWLRQNYASDDETLRALVEMFVEGAEERLRELAKAVRDGDEPVAASARHSLLGSSGTIRAMRMHGMLVAHRQLDEAMVRELEREYAALHACFVETVGIPPR